MSYTKKLMVFGVPFGAVAIALGRGGLMLPAFIVLFVAGVILAEPAGAE